MVKSIDIHGYRCFERLTVPDLARVNLFVGRNNAGKTALLDAVDLLATRTDPYALWRASLRRGEVVLRPAQQDSGNWHEAELKLGLLRYGRGEGPATSLRVAGMLAGERVSIAIGTTEHNASRVLWVESEVGSRAEYILRGDVLYEQLPLWVDPNRAPKQAGSARDVASLCFLGTVYDLGEMLAGAWGDIALSEGEEQVIQALRVIEPDVERVAYLPAEGVGRGHGFFVKLRGVRDRVPMGSLGDGMRRLLALAMTLVQSRGGVLLVDEIDTGLHYSVMPALWRLVLETARRLDVQVFATTHSRDCLEGIAALPPDVLGDDLAVYRLERGNPVAVRYAGAEMAIAAEAALEVR